MVPSAISPQRSASTAAKSLSLHLPYTLAMPKPGPVPKPKPGDRKRTQTEDALAAISATMGKARKRVSSQDRAFVELYADRGFKDAYQCLKDAGYKRASRVDLVLARLQHLIEATRLQRALATQMELDEALIGVAGLARTATDSKVMLAALRTVLEVHGALSPKPLPPADRAAMVAQVEAIIGRLKGAAAASPGSRARVRAVVRGAPDGTATAAFELQTEPASASALASAPAPPSPLALAPHPASDPALPSDG